VPSAFRDLQLFTLSDSKKDVIEKIKLQYEWNQITCMRLQDMSDKDGKKEVPEERTVHVDQLREDRLLREALEDMDLREEGTRESLRAGHVLFEILGDVDKLAFEEDHHPPKWWFFTEEGVNHVGITALKAFLSFLRKYVDKGIPAMSNKKGKQIEEIKEHVRKILRQEQVQQFLKERFPEYKPK